MAWRSRATSRARGTTCRSTRSCWSAVAASRTCRACATRSCVGRSTPPACPTARRPARSTACRPSSTQMPRRAAAGIRPLDPDSVYQSKLVQQVINKVMIDGKKSTSEKIVYDALEMLARRTNKEPVESLEASIRALTPNLEVRSRRVGGATYQVPVEVPARRARTLAVRWLIQFSRARREKTMAERLAGELADAQSD